MSVYVEKFNAFSGISQGIEPLTDGLCAQISKFNTYLSPNEVQQCLLKGVRIYSTFSYWQLRTNEPKQPQTAQ